LLHNDYRLDNCLLERPIPGRIEEVLDWDMCTQGDPLADLGYVLNYWVEPGDNPRNGARSRRCRLGAAASRAGPRQSTVTPRAPGFDVAAIGWHQVFAAFKLAVINPADLHRFVRGQTQDQRFRLYWRRVLGLAAKARVLAGS